MDKNSPESAVFLACKTAIYLLLTGVLGLLIWAGLRLVTLDTYAKIQVIELLEAIENSPAEIPFS